MSFRPAGPTGVPTPNTGFAAGAAAVTTGCLVKAFNFARTADFVFSGGNLDVQGQGVVRQGGLSGTTTPARNLRGIGVRVPVGAKRLAVRFDRPEADSAYSVVVQGNWFTLDRVAEKRADGFDVEFSEPAPQEAALDWQLVR